MKFSIFTGEKNLCILHGQVFIMSHAWMEQTFPRYITVTDERKRCKYGMFFSPSGKQVSVMYTPLYPTFIYYKAKLGFAGLYLFFLFLHQNID